MSINNTKADIHNFQISELKGAMGNSEAEDIRSKNYKKADFILT
jgi:hypothetical protein